LTGFGQFLTLIFKIKVGETMENVNLEYLFKRITDLEKLIESYFNHLKIDNDLDFILNGSYFLKEELENILIGNY
jgi:hypothetical protein